MSYMGLYLPYLSYTFVIPRMAVFTVDSYVDMTPFTPMILVEIYRHVILCMPVLLAETSMHTIMYSSVHVTSVHALTQPFVHVPP